MSRDTTLLLIDARYLLEGLRSHLGVDSLAQLRVDPAPLIGDLMTHTAGRTRPLTLVTGETFAAQRVVWYDASPAAKLTAQHQAIALLPRVEVRLGYLERHNNGSWVPKGVDSAMACDLALAAESASPPSRIDVLAADGNLWPGARHAANRGVRLQLWTLPTDDGSPAAHQALAATASTIRPLPWELLTRHVMLRTPSVAGGLRMSVDPCGRPGCVGDTSCDASTHVASLQELTTPQQHAIDLNSDQAAAPWTMTRIAELYAQRWCERSFPEHRRRLAAWLQTQPSGREQLPRNLDADLLRYVDLHGMGSWQASKNQRRILRATCVRSLKRGQRTTQRAAS